MYVAHVVAIVLKTDFHLHGYPHIAHYPELPLPVLHTPDYYIIRQTLTYLTHEQ